MSGGDVIGETLSSLFAMSESSGANIVGSIPCAVLPVVGRYASG